MRILLFFLTLQVLLFSCSQEDKRTATEIFRDEDVDIEDKIERALKSDYLDSLGVDSTASKMLRDVYAKREFEPIWIDESTVAERGLNFEKLKKNALKLGVPSSRFFKLPKDSLCWIDSEINYTLQFAGLVRDLDSGFVDIKKKSMKQLKLAEGARINSLFEKLHEQTNVAPLLLSCGPKNLAYKKLAKWVYTHYDLASIETSCELDETESVDFSRSGELFKALKVHGFIEKFVSEDDVKNKLHDFQQANGIEPDDKIGKYTAKAFKETPQSKFLRAVINLDRMRQYRRDLSSSVHINIPEFLLRYYYNNKLKATHRLVVGAVATPTPEVNSSMDRIILYPYWSVPSSIAKNEIMPSLRNGSGYIKRNNMKLFRDGSEVNPDSIDWTTIPSGSCPFSFKQDPGRGNSLGIIKFDFPNPYHVYVHDTPTKHLFSKEFRAYSHGCMRCQFPVKLARTIYHYDLNGDVPMISDSNYVDKRLKNKGHGSIKLKKKVPVFVEYCSVVYRKNQVVHLIDVYNYDKRYFNLFIQQNN